MKIIFVKYTLLVSSRDNSLKNSGMSISHYLRPELEYQQTEDSDTENII